MKNRLFTRGPVIKWALYDWANSAFSTTIIAGFFPIFFKQYWSQGLDSNVSTYYLGMANSVAGLALVLLSPFLGLIATSPQRKQKGLFLTTALGCAGTLALTFIAAGAAATAAGIFCFTVIAFTCCFVFYDSLLPDVVPREDYDQASSFGYALGYLGGGILFLVNAWMALKPEAFGLAGPTEAVIWSFYSVVAWWSLFSLPLLLAPAKDFQFEDKKENDLKSAGEFLSGLKVTATEILKNRALLLFLLSYFFYIEGVNTTIKMAVDYGLSIGLESGDMIKALLLVQFVAFPFALVFGWIGQRFGATTGIFICIGVYLGNSIFAHVLSTATHFFIMAALIGMVQGGIQALSRSHFSALVPIDRTGPYFGFFNMLGRFSSIVGPALIGLVSLLTGSARSSIYVLILFFALGLVLLWAHRQFINRPSPN